MKIDIEKKFDEMLEKILREKVDIYFGESPTAKRRVRIARDPMEAMQNLDDEIKDVEKKLDPRTKHGIEKVKMAISQGARTRSTISENAEISASATVKYLKMMIHDGTITTHPDKGYILTEE